MTLYRNKYRVESNRKKGHDYSSPGFYFVTLCVKNREHLFGHVENGKMLTNSFGLIVQQCWDDLPNHYPNFFADAFIVMPNHIHAIMQIIAIEKPKMDIEMNGAETGLCVDGFETRLYVRNHTNPRYFGIRAGIKNVFGTSH